MYTQLAVIYVLQVGRWFWAHIQRSYPIINYRARLCIRQSFVEFVTIANLTFKCCINTTIPISSYLVSLHMCWTAITFLKPTYIPY